LGRSSGAPSDLRGVRPNRADGHGREYFESVLGGGISGEEQAAIPEETPVLDEGVESTRRA